MDGDYIKPATLFLGLGFLAASLIGCQSSVPSEQKSSIVKNVPAEKQTRVISSDWAPQAVPVSKALVLPKGETGFYTPPASEGVRVNLAKDFNLIADGIADDSKPLQKALNQVSQNGGGTVFVPKGTYVFSGIKMRSNVRLQIESETLIRPVKAFSKKNAKKRGGELSSITIFEFGKRSEKIENVSVEGVGGSFHVELEPYEPGVAIFGMGNVENFRISSVEVRDALTKFSAITMGPSVSRDGNQGFPTKGYVSDISQLGAHYGYGVVQTQGAYKVLFENLSGEGGAVLRMETGAKRVNDEQFGGVDNLVAKNISCKDGNAAVMISPHAMHNGIVVVDGVQSDGCGFAVRIGNGYIAKKYSNPNLEAGTFANGSRVSNIYARFGENAQLKSKHYKYMPEKLLSKIAMKTEDGSSYRGPSISPVLNTANFEVIIEDITAEGFSNVHDIVAKPASRNNNIK